MGPTGDLHRKEKTGRIGSVGIPGWGYKILVLMLTYEEGRAFGLSLPSLSLESVEPRHNGTYNT
jgi:hypothetical protein